MLHFGSLHILFSSFASAFMLASKDACTLLGGNWTRFCLWICRMVGELSAVKWGYANGKILSNTAYLKISMVSMALKYFSNRHGFPKRAFCVCGNGTGHLRCLDKYILHTLYNIHSEIHILLMGSVQMLASIVMVSCAILYSYIYHTFKYQTLATTKSHQFTNQQTDNLHSTVHDKQTLV